MEAKARELIAHLDKRGRLADLVRVGRELRPDIAWPEVRNETGAEPEARSLVEILAIVAVVIAGIGLVFLVFAPAIVPKRIALKTYHGRYVTAMGEDHDWDIIAKTVEIEDFEKFTLIDLDDGKVAFKTFHNRYVTATDEAQNWDIRAEAARMGDWETFMPIPLGNDKVALKTFHNRYVTAMGADRNWELVTEAAEIDLFEEFEIVPLGCFRVMVALGLMTVVDVP
jgi:hypothetical protein